MREETYWACEARFADGTTWTGTCTGPRGATSEDVRPSVLEKIARDFPHTRGQECGTWLATELSAQTYRSVVAEQLHTHVYGPPRERWPFSARIGVPLFLPGLVLVVLGNFLPGSKWIAAVGVLPFVLGMMAMVYAWHFYGQWWAREGEA